MDKINVILIAFSLMNLCAIAYLIFFVKKKFEVLENTLRVESKELRKLLRLDYKAAIDEQQKQIDSVKEEIKKLGEFEELK